MSDPVRNEAARGWMSDKSPEGIERRRRVMKANLRRSDMENFADLILQAVADVLWCGDEDWRQKFYNGEGWGKETWDELLESVLRVLERKA